MRALFLLCFVGALGCGCGSGETTVDGGSTSGEVPSDAGADAAETCNPEGSMSMCTDGFVLCMECACAGQRCGFTYAVDGEFDYTNIKGGAGDGVCREDGSCAPRNALPNWDPCPSALCGELGF